jgi:hypothetical protein
MQAYFELCHARLSTSSTAAESAFTESTARSATKTRTGSSPKGWTKIGAKRITSAKREALTGNTSINGIRCKFNSKAIYWALHRLLKINHVFLTFSYYYYKTAEMQTVWPPLNGKTYYLWEDELG